VGFGIGRSVRSVFIFRFIIFNFWEDTYRG